MGLWTLNSETKWEGHTKGGGTSSGRLTESPITLSPNFYVYLTHWYCCFFDFFVLLARIRLTKDSVVPYSLVPTVVITDYRLLFTSNSIPVTIETPSTSVPFSTRKCSVTGYEYKCYHRTHTKSQITRGWLVTESLFYVRLNDLIKVRSGRTWKRDYREMCIKVTSGIE